MKHDLAKPRCTLTMYDETNVKALLEPRPKDNARKGPKYLTRCARVWDPKHLTEASPRRLCAVRPTPVHPRVANPGHQRPQKILRYPAHSGCGAPNWHSSVVRSGARAQSDCPAHSDYGAPDWQNSMVQLGTNSLGFQTLQQEPDPFRLWCH